MSDNNKFYITTPIYYASGKLHLGHCYTTVYSDALARFHRLNGNKVFFLTGSDEHGQKIARAAKKMNKSPKSFVDEVVSDMKDLWKLMGISYDKFIRTTDLEHEKVVKKIFTKLYEKGDIYKSKYSGWYCIPCETFYKKDDLNEGNKCPDCGREVEWTEEDSYFFKASKYQEKLLEFFNNNPEFITPDSRKQEMINSFIKNGLDDICVSRTTFDWGVEVEFDSKHVVYVWIDALTNYLSAIGYNPDGDSEDLFKKFWAPDVQVIGREISRFHMIIWPIMLFALGLELPKKIHSHGWLTLKGAKMGKSMGNGFDPYILVDKYGLDAVRYYLLKEGPMIEDAGYRSERFIDSINADLTNDLGNLLSRTVKMVMNSFDGEIPKFQDSNDSNDKNLIKKAATLNSKIINHMSKNDTKKALNEIFDLIRSANKYIDLTMPWILAKKEDDESKKRLSNVLYILCEVLRISAVSLTPFLIETPDKIFNQLGIKNDDMKSFESIKEFGKIPSGLNVEKGENLFKRYNREEEVKFLESSSGKNKKANDVDKSISLKDFAKIDIRVGEIVECENIKNSDKLFKIKIVDGGKEYQAVSGLARSYKSSELMGKKVTFITNLKKTKIMGVESNAMILAAGSNKDNISLIVPDSKDVESGEKVS